MAIRATEVFRWLADGSIEQVGDLPRAAHEPDPVFAVNSPALRAELVARLAGIGKSPVVLTPLGVRSFLLRTMLLGKNAGEGNESENAARELVAALDPAEATQASEALMPTPIVDGVDADVVEHLLETDLAAVLQDALQEVAPDVEAMLQLAAEIAAAESAAIAHEPWAGPDEDIADESDAPPAEPEVTEADEPEVEFDYDGLDDDDDEDLDACFDLDELTKLEAAVHAAAEEPESVTDAPAIEEEAAMNEDFDAPNGNLGDDLQQHQPESTAAADPTSAAPDFEQLFAEPVPEPAEDSVEPDATEADGLDADAIDRAFDDVLEAVAETIESSAEPSEATVAEAPDDTEPSEQPEPVEATEQSVADAAETEVAAEAEAEPDADALFGEHPTAPLAETEEPARDEAEAAAAEEQIVDDVVEAVAESVEATEQLVAAEVAGEAETESLFDDDSTSPHASTEDQGEALTFDETPAPAEAADVDEVEDAPNQPEPIAEEVQNVNEVQSGEENTLEATTESDAATSGNGLEDSAEGLLAQALATVEAEQAGVAATTTDELLTETPSSKAPSFDEDLVDAVTAAVEAEMTTGAEPGGEEFALTSQAMDKVQDFLGELRGALVEMAQRPQPQASATPIDVAPLIQAVQAGFDRSAEQATQASTALASLAERVGQFGQQVEASVQQSVKALAEQQHRQEAQASAPVATVDRPRFLVQRPGRQALVLGAVAILVVCWSILFWFKTGSPRLAFGTLIGANLVGCCLLVARRD